MINFVLGRKKKTEESVSFVKALGSDRDFDELRKLKDRIKEHYDMCLIKVDDVEKLRRYIDKASNFFDKIIVLGTSDKINRTALEHKKVWALLDPENAHKDERDYDSYRNSGFNHVLCKIAMENKKIILISLDELKDKKQLGRAIKNLKLCKKYKTPAFLVNFTEDVSDLKSKFEIKEILRVLMNGEHFEHVKID